MGKFTNDQHIHNMCQKAFVKIFLIKVYYKKNIGVNIITNEINEKIICSFIHHRLSTNNNILKYYRYIIIEIFSGNLLTNK